jgi:hypothetical protein
LSIETVLQAHQTVCEEWHKWVLNRGRQVGAEEAEALADPGAVEDGDFWHGWVDDSEVQEETSEWKLPDQFAVMRPVQQEALRVIQQAHRIGKQQVRTATAAIVTPTGTGKDLLPLALAHCLEGTSVVFVPYA